MTQPVNLNRYRKAKARVEKRAQADSNAVAFGRTKSEKEQAARENSRAARKLDGKVLQTPLGGTEDNPEKP